LDEYFSGVSSASSSSLDLFPTALMGGVKTVVSIGGEGSEEEVSISAATADTEFKDPEVYKKGE
jgi:hypothetical protein